LVTSVLPSISLAFSTTSSTEIRQADAALGVLAQFLELALAAAAGMDLAFDHVKRSGHLFRPFFGLLGRVDGDAAGDGRAV
jgi:hypothetical protein